ncbi:MAG: MFS transporter [Chlamydiales bacterium]|nr:MFS transporter [Chlamydiales bacterium]
MPLITKKQIFLICIGNILEHFDKALYGLLVPFISAIFFSKHSYLTGCIILFTPFGWFARPLGAYVIGSISNRYGKEIALYISLIGTSMCSAAIGLIPSYATIGIAAPVLIVLFRSFLSFFYAGETTGAPLLILENTNPSKKEWWSSIYEMSGIMGSILATAFVVILLYFDMIENYWRLLFLFGAICGLIAFFFRKKKQSYINVQQEKISFLQFIKTYKKEVLLITLLTGFAYANYDIITSVMNIYFPLVMETTYLSMLSICLLLMVLDLILLPVFGWIGVKIGQERLIYASLLSFILLTPLGFFLLQTPTLLSLFLIRLIFVTIGTAFAAPFQSYVKEIAGRNNTYLTMAFGKALGAQCIGHPAIGLSLFIYQQTHLVMAPFIYPFLLCITILGALYITKHARIPQHRY